MEEAVARSHRTVVLAFLAISLALVGALIFMHAADAADRAERARLEERLDNLNKQIVTIQAEMATAPSATPVPQLADAAVGDFPAPPKSRSQLQNTDGPASTQTRGNENLGF